MTPAITVLERAAIAHRVLTYEHDPANDAYGLEAAEALGVDPDLVYKTLVVELAGGGSGTGGSAAARHAVGVVPVTATLDLKALATAAGAKRATMADRTDAERMTGYVRGGISPLGQKRRLPTFVDETAAVAELIYVSGGRRGLDIELSPNDLADLLDATFAPIGVSS